MPLNNVTLTGNLGAAAAGAIAVFTPAGWLADPTDQLLIPPAAQQVTLGSTGTFSVPLLATDNANTPDGWTWTITLSGIPAVPEYSFSFLLPHANGATQDISALAQTPAVTPTQAYLPLPAGTPTSGQVPVATGAGEASAWGGPIPQIDSNAADIQPVGAAAAAGSAGKAADARHVHVGMGVLATTGASGFALTNGTGTILTWTVPADGNLHWVIPWGEVVVTSAETGGQVLLTYTDPGGTVRTNAPDAGGHGTGLFPFNNFSFAVKAGTTVTLSQNTALIVGVATVYAGLLGF